MIGSGTGFTSYPYGVLDVPAAMRIPAIARGMQLYSGLIKQCPIDAYRGPDPLARPPFLERPDPDEPRSTFVQVQVEDYLTHGNALHLVTQRNAEGWPAMAAWVPAAWVSIEWRAGKPTRYLVGNRELPFENVVHVKRGSDRRNPGRGVGIVEQHLATLDRIAAEEEYERNTLLSAGVPSVVIRSPNPDLSQSQADDAKAMWVTKHAGPIREPSVVPGGVDVIPLAWSPSDAQLVEARKLSLLDVANMLNLDGYWVGAPAASMTYRSPGPMYLTLLRTSLEPVLADLEQVWSAAWLPRGQSIRFDRLALTRDDFASSVDTLTKAVAAGLISIPEARQYLGLAASIALGGPTVISPIDTEEGTIEGDGTGEALPEAS